MSDGAAFCVDMLLPKCRYRQWTATFPWHIRYLMAKDHKLVTALGRVVTNAIFTFQRKQAKRAGIRSRPGARRWRCGSASARPSIPTATLTFWCPTRSLS
jgi:hypothetical protein